MVKAVNAGGVPVSNWRHFDDVAVKQFDAIVLCKNAGFSHSVVVGHGEAVAGGRKCLL